MEFPQCVKRFNHKCIRRPMPSEAKPQHWLQNLLPRGATNIKNKKNRSCNHEGGCWKHMIVSNARIIRLVIRLSRPSHQRTADVCLMSYHGYLLVRYVVFVIQGDTWNHSVGDPLSKARMIKFSMINCGPRSSWLWTADFQHYDFEWLLFIPSRVAMCALR